MTVNDYFNTPINEDYFSISPEWDTPIHGGWEEDYFSNRGYTHWDSKTSTPSEMVSLKRQYHKEYHRGYKKRTKIKKSNHTQWWGISTEDK